MSKLLPSPEIPSNAQTTRHRARRFNSMKQKFSLGFALLAALLLRVFFACATPTGFETVSRGISWFSDERAHINYVRHLALARRLPVQTNSVKVPCAFARGDYEYYQPPLSYVAQTPAWMLGEVLRPGLGWLFVRLLDALFGVATVLVGWLIAKKISPGNEIWAAWFLALQPGFCYQGTLASNDPLFWFLGSLFLLKTLDFAEGKSPWPLAPLACAALLTKSSGIAPLPLPFFALLLTRTKDITDSVQRFRFRSNRFIGAAAAIGTGILFALPWYFRNHCIYGSWMSLEVGHGAPYQVMQTISNIQMIKMLVLYFATSIWFPIDQEWVIHPLPRAIFSLASLACIAPFIISWRRLRESSTWILFACILLGVGAMIPYAIRYRQSEARHLFYLLPAFVALWCVAARPHVARWGALALLPSLLTWAWIAFRFF